MKKYFMPSLLAAFLIFCYIRAVYYDISAPEVIILFISGAIIIFVNFFELMNNHLND